MSARIIAQIPSMTAEQRQQLQHNCARALERSADTLVTLEARSILGCLQSIEQREAAFIARLSRDRQIEYAFRRLPANAQERQAIRAVHELGEATPRRLNAMFGSLDDRPWHRIMGTLCRTRRHLLPHGPNLDSLDETTVAALGWAVSLLDFTAATCMIALKPAAAAAFERLGYVEPRGANEPVALIATCPPLGRDGAALSMG